jgi:hypothetical protein
MTGAFLFRDRGRPSSKDGLGPFFCEDLMKIWPAPSVSRPSPTDPGLRLVPRSTPTTGSGYSRSWSGFWASQWQDFSCPLCHLRLGCGHPTVTSPLPAATDHTPSSHRPHFGENLSRKVAAMGRLTVRIVAGLVVLGFLTGGTGQARAEFMTIDVPFIRNPGPKEMARHIRTNDEGPGRSQGCINRAGGVSVDPGPVPEPPGGSFLLAPPVVSD